MKQKNNNIVKPIIIIGAGGHACVIADCLISMGVNIIGFTDIKDNNFIYNNIKIIGKDDVVFKYKNTDINLVIGIGIVPHKNNRLKIIRRFYEKKYTICSVISTKAIISESVQISQGVQILQGVVIQANVKIGNYSIINTNVSVDHNSYIGRNCHIAPGVTICGNVRIHDNVFIGSGSTIVQGITIGVNSFIPAGSTVIKDVQDNSVLKLENNKI